MTPQASRTGSPVPPQSDRLSLKKLCECMNPCEHNHCPCLS